MIDTVLEDRSGNNLRTPFEVDLTKLNPRLSEAASVSIAFEIRD